MSSSREDIERQLQEQAKHDRTPSRHRGKRPKRQGAPRRGLAYGIGGFGLYGVLYNPQGQQPPPVTEQVQVPGQSEHLNPAQFVGFPGGFTTTAGNYTGVQAISGAAGNGGAGGGGGGGGGAAAGGGGGGV